MTHEERWQLAQAVCTRMTQMYPGDVIIGGVYGSTARGTDTAWSDLEMLFVVRDSSTAKGQHFIYRGTAVGYLVIEEVALMETLTTPMLKWPFYMGVLSVLHVLYGDPGRIEVWLRLGQAVPPEKFKAALEAALPGLVVESYGRILSCRQRGNVLDIWPAVLEVLDEGKQALCLLNRRWVTHDYYQGLVDTLDFPKLPEGYRELVPTLWTARTIEEIVPLATRLVENFWRLLDAEGIHVLDCQSVEGIPV